MGSTGSLEQTDKLAVWARAKVGAERLVTNARESVDLTNCDREPIHLLGTIQPHGFLIAVTKDWLVTRASENIAQFLGCTADAIIGRPLAEFILPRAVHDLRNKVGILRGADALERIFACELIKSAYFDVAIHVSGAFIVIECEPGEVAAQDTTGTVRSMIARLDLASDMTAFYREGAPDSSAPRLRSGHGLQV